MSSGDPALSVFLAHRGELLNYAHTIMGDHAQAEDVVQEAYLRFCAANVEKASSQVPSIANPVAYLYAIVRNLAVTVLRRSSFETQIAPGPDAFASIASDAPSAESVLFHKDELRTLASALVELPERTRIAFNMHRIEGRPLREVAERLDISVTRAQQLVKAAMLHGVRRLRETSR